MIGTSDLELGGSWESNRCSNAKLQLRTFSIRFGPHQSSFGLLHH